MNFKFIILITTFSLQYCIGFTQGAAEFWGMTKNGGPWNQGVIFQVDSNGENLQIAYDFPYNEGLHPYGSLALANNGKYYGMTLGGGANHDGVIFEFDAVTEKSIKRHDFDSATSGNCPRGSLLLASDSLFYGMTEYGGANNRGCIFSFNTLNFAVTKLFDFDSINGSRPNGSLIQASDGFLYGITQYGGASNSGILFQFDITTNTYQKKFDFDDTLHGINPSGSLVQDSIGKLYGIATIGGSNYEGVLFEYNPALESFSKLADFDYIKTGSNPTSSPIINQNGNLMGTTSQGASNNLGGIFEYDFSLDSIIIKADFTGFSSPFSSLVQINDSIFLGTACYGPNGGYGCVYSFNMESNAIVPVQAFGQVGRPYGTMIMDGSGNLLGLCAGSMIDLTKGSIYIVDVTNFSVKNILFFGEGMLGAYPDGSLCLGSNGLLYGFASILTTPFQDFVIFEFDPFSDVYEIKKNGNAFPPIGSSGLTEVSTDILYSSLGGKIIKYDISTNNLSAPYPSLQGVMNGTFLKLADGNLYGLTDSINYNDKSCILKYSPTANTLTVLHAFKSSSGYHPYGDLVQGADNALWGLTSSGGNYNNGVLFRIDPVSGIYSVLHHFSGPDGSTPLGSLCRASNNNLYGLTSKGGSNNLGVLFEYDITSHSFTKLFDFDGNNGGTPMGTLTESSAGKLLGLTNKGGLYNEGVVFMYDYLSSSVSKKIDFDGSNGAYPEYTKLLKIGGTVNPVTPCTSFVYPNPTTNSVYIITPDSGQYIVQLFNVNGLPIKSQSFSGYNSYLFDTNNLTPGIYFIKLSNNEVELIDTILIL